MLFALRQADDEEDEEESATSSATAVASAASSYVSAAAVVTALGLLHQNPSPSLALITVQVFLDTIKRPQNAAECARARAKRSGLAAERKKEEEGDDEEVE